MANKQHRAPCLCFAHVGTYNECRQQMRHVWNCRSILLTPDIVMLQGLPAVVLRTLVPPVVLQSLILQSLGLSMYRRAKSLSLMCRRFAHLIAAAPAGCQRTSPCLLACPPHGSLLKPLAAAGLRLLVAHGAAPLMKQAATGLVVRGRPEPL